MSESLASEPQEILEEPSQFQEQEDDQHLLSSYWTLWTQVVTSGKHSKFPLGPIFDFQSVEEFWAIYNSLKLPSQLTGRVDMLFFRSEPAAEEGKFNRIHPEWEDANNIGGGEYRVTISGTNQDKQWELTTLAILGGSLELSEDVAGVWLGCGRKQGNTLCLWKKTPDEETDPDAVQKLGDAWLAMLKKSNVPIAGDCTYISHRAALEAATKKTSPAPEKTWKQL